jgi:hypothetical protein
MTVTAAVVRTAAASPNLSLPLGPDHNDFPALIAGSGAVSADPDAESSFLARAARAAGTSPGAEDGGHFMDVVRL